MGSLTARPWIIALEHVQEDCYARSPGLAALVDAQESGLRHAQNPIASESVLCTPQTPRLGLPDRRLSPGVHY
jgi:hypothetical protein